MFILCYCFAFSFLLISYSVIFTSLSSLYPHPQFKSLLSALDSCVVERELVLSDDRSTVLVSRVSHHIKVGRPHLKLPLPVDDGGERSADQERALSVTLRNRDGKIHMVRQSEHSQSCTTRQ